jgi:hypothetical protein
MSFKSPLIKSLLSLALFFLFSTEGKAAEPIRVATFQADVTPPIGAPLCGGAVKPVKEIIDPLSARGIIILSDQKPIVLCSVDWVGIGNGGHDQWRESLANAVETTVDRVTVNVIHQHDAPSCDFATEKLLAEVGISGAMFDVKSCRGAMERTAKSAKECLKSAKPITHIGTGIGKVEKVASNRRVLGPDGKVKVVRWSSTKNKEAIDAPEGTVDSYVRLISFWNQEIPLVSVTHYATHPQSFYGRGGVTFDFVGMAREIREHELPGVKHIHFNGAGGNVTAGKYNNGEPYVRPILAKRLALGMKKAWESTKKKAVTSDDLEWRTVPTLLPVREDLKESKLVAILHSEKANVKSRIRAARDLTFLRRMNSGKGIPLHSLRIGNAYTLYLPGELFIEYQLAAMGMRPDDFVACAAYSDYGPGYIGMEISYTQGGYETGKVSRTAPSVEKVLMSSIKKLLED